MGVSPRPFPAIRFGRRSRQPPESAENPPTPHPDASPSTNATSPPPSSEKSSEKYRRASYARRTFADGSKTGSRSGKGFCSGSIAFFFCRRFRRQRRQRAFAFVLSRHAVAHEIPSPEMDVGSVRSVRQKLVRFVRLGVETQAARDTRRESILVALAVLDGGVALVGAPRISLFFFLFVALPLAAGGLLGARAGPRPARGRAHARPEGDLPPLRRERVRVAVSRARRERGEAPALVHLQRPPPGKVRRPRQQRCESVKRRRPASLTRNPVAAGPAAARALARSQAPLARRLFARASLEPRRHHHGHHVRDVLGEVHGAGHGRHRRDRIGTSRGGMVSERVAETTRNRGVTRRRGAQREDAPELAVRADAHVLDGSEPRGALAGVVVREERSRHGGDVHGERGPALRGERRRRQRHLAVQRARLDLHE
mmetsp:Transcript_3631/g.14637  ORF Transcript_3631/g.14637 Transcript_3631/m.14637 type:complete len:427 (+) Transcript_3631:138-1418(+)